MSDDNRGPGGAGDGIGSSTRIGTSERDAAMALLAEHWRSGRLDPGEHELRVTRAKAAVTRADLDVLFADLPPAGPAPAASGAVVTSGTQGLLAGKRDMIMALTPFAALVLFFVTHSWLWFLMIPVMGILLHGPEGNKSSRRGRRRDGRGCGDR